MCEGWNFRVFRLTGLIYYLILEYIVPNLGVYELMGGRYKTVTINHHRMYSSRKRFGDQWCGCISGFISSCVKYIVCVCVTGAWVYNSLER